MKKRFLLVCAAFALSITMLFAGCGEGKGAEDTGEDGKVGGSSATTSPTEGHTAPTTSGDLMDDAEDLVEDVLPGGDPSTAATTKK